MVNLLYMLTFFCACLAISGKAEEQRRSGLTFWKVEERSRYTSCLCLRLGKYQINSDTQTEKRQKKVHEWSIQIQKSFQIELQF